MKVVEKILFGICLGLICCQFCHAQSSEADLKRMQTYYSSLDELDMSVKTAFYLNGKASITTNRICKSKGNYYYENGQEKMLVTPQCMLMIRDKEKSIIVKTYGEKEYKALTAGLEKQSMDSLGKGKKPMNYVGTDKLGRRYEVSSSSGPISKTILVLDSINYSIRQIEYEYRKKGEQKASAKSDYNYNAFIKDNPLLKIENYVIKKEGSWVGASAYRNYRVTNFKK